jgi:hypothetical protein
MKIRHTQFHIFINQCYIHGLHSATCRSQKKGVTISCGAAAGLTVSVRISSYDEQGQTGLFLLSVMA